eukprot:2478612-Pyramimonas_sp.AAC.1
MSDWTGRSDSHERREARAVPGSQSRARTRRPRVQGAWLDGPGDEEDEGQGGGGGPSRPREAQGEGHGDQEARQR